VEVAGLGFSAGEKKRIQIVSKGWTDGPGEG